MEANPDTDEISFPAGFLYGFAAVPNVRKPDGANYLFGPPC